MKIFIVSTPLYGYCSQVVNAFSSAGHACDAYAYGIPGRFLNRLFPFNRLYRKFFFFRENKKILRLFSGKGVYDTILFFGMCEMSLPQIDRLRKQGEANVIFWFLDSIYRHKKFFSCLSACDFAFTYNLNDCKALQGKGIRNSFLPLFYDQSVYFPINIPEKEHDIFFIGALKSRIKYLNNLAKNIDKLHPGLRIRYYGQLSPIFILLNKNRYPAFFRHHINSSLSHIEINQMYNSSEICLNIQPAQATSALNIRTFEICGSGSLQFTDGNYDLLSSLFSPGTDLIYFSDLKDLVALICDFFEDKKLFDYTLVRNECRRNINGRHTINKRVERILEVVAELSEVRAAGQL